MSRLPFALIAACACVFLGVCAGRRLQRRSQRLYTWLCAVQSLSAALSCARLPLADALRASGLKDIADILLHAPCEGAQKAFARSLSGQEKLAPGALLALEAAFASLDRDTLPGQVAALAFAHKRLSALHMDAEAKCVRDAKLYSQLGCLSGVAILILLM